jgi:hypothetical protein
MSDEREKIARRIRGLLNLSADQSVTEQEAIEAARKARELMDKYRVTMTDVEIKAEPVELDEVKSAYATTAPVDYCRPGIMAYCGVKLWFESHRGAVRRVKILGLKADTDMAGWLYTMLQTALESDWRAYKKTPAWRELTGGGKRSATQSFFVGMAVRINERLLELAEALEPVAKTASGTALVVIKNQLVDAAFAELDLHFRKSRGLSIRDGGAYHAGKAAGDRVNLNRPIGAAAAARRLATTPKRVTRVK